MFLQPQTLYMWFKLGYRIQNGDHTLTISTFYFLYNEWKHGSRTEFFMKRNKNKLYNLMSNLKPKWLRLVRDLYAIFTLIKYFVDARLYNLCVSLLRQILSHLWNFYYFFNAALLNYKKKKMIEVAKIKKRAWAHFCIAMSNGPYSGFIFLWVFIAHPWTCRMPFPLICRTFAMQPRCVLL